MRGRENNGAVFCLNFIIFGGGLGERAPVLYFQAGKIMDPFSISISFSEGGLFLWCKINGSIFHFHFIIFGGGIMDQFSISISLFLEGDCSSGAN